MSETTHGINLTENIKVDEFPDRWVVIIYIINPLC